MTTKQGAHGAKQHKTHHRRGGVSPKLKAPAIFGVEIDEKAIDTTSTTQIARAFTNHGGPVISDPQVYTSFWGALWTTNPTYQARVARLNQFHTDLLQSGFMNMLHQYGVGTGAGSGAFVGTSTISNVPTELTDSAIQGIIQTNITAGILPEPTNPSNVALIVYLDETIGINDPGAQLVLCEPTHDTAFGYHSFFITQAGHAFYYAMIPALADACLQESCSDDTQCSLHLAETQEQRITQVASHEFAEMTTDPQLDAWYAPNPWGENGDICNGESEDITVGANTWNVQRIYSKYTDRHTHGATHCLAQAPQPLPHLRH